MSEIEQLRKQVARLQQRVAIGYAIVGIFVLTGILTATMGMANNQRKPGESIVASRLAIVDQFGNEIMTMGPTTDNRAGIWLKRGSSTNSFLVQQADNTAHLWARNYRLESSADRDVALLGISTEGRAGMWLMNGSNSNNILLQQPDNNARFWGQDFYVKHNNRTVVSMGAGSKGTGGVWLWNGNNSKWALAINP